MAATYTVTTTWHDIAASHPAAEIEVLVAVEGQDSPTQAYLCDVLEDGRPVFAHINSGMPIRGNVYAWAVLPGVPGCSFFQSAKGGA